MKVTEYGNPFMPLAIVLETKLDIKLMKELLTKSTREHTEWGTEESKLAIFQQHIFDALKAKER